MRFRKQDKPERNGDHIDEPLTEPAPAADALALAEEAEAEAAEAEAAAAAARARARALRLRREAEAAAKSATTTPKTAAAKGEDAEAAAPEPEADNTDEAVADSTDDVADDIDDADDAEEAETAQDADEAEQSDEQPAKKRRRFRVPLPSWRAVAASMTILVIAALLAGCGYMFWYHRHTQAEESRRAEFNAAARQGVVTLMSLDYNKAKEDVQRIIDNSTGQFKEDFQNTADDFIKVAQDSKAVTETMVTASAVESMTDDTATVIVAASSKVTNAAGAKQEPRSWRLSVNLARDGGQLKMSKVEFVP